ncbi:MAG: DNA mismatch repair protein MutS, partial [Patescibacteria group bacterium]|nr:DNA mismatch repair protein MutS [Patescibacteria group bacterium]
DGVSIAWAIAEYINNEIHARTIFATHYHELIKLESDLDGVRNLNVAVLEDKGNVIFLRKIEQGGTDKSYGIHVAKMAGLPAPLIKRAQKILAGFEQEDMFGVRSNKMPTTKDQTKDDDEVIQEENKYQLSFMDPTTAESAPNIFSELKKVDLDNLTPVEALNLVERWKKRLTR